MMDKIAMLLLALVMLCGCSGSAAPAPTAIAPASTNGASPARPTATRPAPSPAPIATQQAQPSAVADPTPTNAPTASPLLAPARLLFGYPIGAPGGTPGDGFFIRHGYQSENTWYNPGYWHTGEDWYAQEGDTAGAQVLAVAAGEVVYAGANYPGRVVLVRHDDNLISMYGHLDPALAVREGQQLQRGDQIGTVLRRSDQTPNHLHFEMRTFVTTGEVNGDGPRYGFRCGVNCPPGPGYWPIDAPDLPSDLGWRNPIHTINRRMLPAGAAAEVVVATRPASNTLTLWNAPGNAGQPSGELRLVPGERYRLVDIQAGPEGSGATSARSYELWYRLRLPDGTEGWAQAAAPSPFETGGDGRPSSIYFNVLPAPQ
jgi:murein DD-endopeptidase MepM/ murein hydrolase activator NlpD